MATTIKTIVKDINGKEMSLTYVQGLSVARQLMAMATEEQVAKVSLTTKDGVEIPMNKDNFATISLKMTLLTDKEAKHNKPSSGSGKETETQKAAREGCAYLMEKADPEALYTLDQIRALLDEGGHAWSGSQATRRMSDLYKTGVLTRYAEKKVTICIGVETNEDGKTVLDEENLGSCPKDVVMYQFSVPTQDEEEEEEISAEE